MADYNSSLPIRTQNDGDVVSKIADATIPSQQLKVNADGSINVGDNGSSLTVDAVDLDIRDLSHTQDSVQIGDGTDILSVNADGSINITDNGGSLTIDDGGGSITVDGSVSITGNVTVDQGTSPWVVGDGGSSLTVDAVDLDIRDLSAAQDSVKSQLADGSGNYYSPSNPIPVTISANNSGDEINDYNTASAIAGGASNNHDYTVTVAKTLLLTQIEASASGKAKIEVQIETGVATNTFVTKFVQFNSTSSPNMQIELKSPISVAAGVRVRVIRTNRDNQAQDLYSTICGQEI